MPLEAGGLAPPTIQLASAELGVPLTAQQADRLARFAALLAKWNRVYNLTKRVAPDEVLTHHLLDSLSIVSELVKAAEGRAVRVLDVGAGGGLPGIPLAIALPDAHFTLIDSVQKKAAFLQQVKAELALTNLEVVHARVEDYRAPLFDVVVCRAFAALDEVVRLSAHLLAADGCWLAMKGAYPTREINALASTSVEMVRAVKLRVPQLDAERHLVVLRFRQAHARHL